MTQLSLVPVEEPEPRVLLGVRIPGEPVPWARAGTHGGRRYNPRRYETWLTGARLVLSSAWAGRAPHRGPVLLVVDAVLERPERAPRHVVVDGEKLAYPFPWQAGRVRSPSGPDLDNVCKAVADALQGPTRNGRAVGLVLANDRLVCGSRADRWYAAEGEGPGVDLWILDPT